MKRELLSHAFNLGYGKDTHKRGPNLDVIQHMKQNLVPKNESNLLKKKNEKQNFKYHEDVSSRLSNHDSLNTNMESRQVRHIGGLGNGKIPTDYWKSNFTFNQVAK